MNTDKIIDLFSAGKTAGEIAEELGLTESYVVDLLDSLCSNCC